MPKLLDSVRITLRTRHYSIRTEQAYLAWIRDYIIFHNKRHPAELGQMHVSAWLSHLAVNRQVSASTQNEPLSALRLLYRGVLNFPLDWLENVQRASKYVFLSVVFT